MYKKTMCYTCKVVVCLLNLYCCCCCCCLFACLFFCLFFDVLVALVSSDLQVPIYLGREGERDAFFFYLLVCRLLCMLPQGKKRTPDRRFIKRVTCFHSLSRLWEVQWVWTKDVKGAVVFEENLKTYLMDLRSSLNRLKESG